MTATTPDLPEITDPPAPVVFLALTVAAAIVVAVVVKRLGAIAPEPAYTDPTVPDYTPGDYGDEGDE